MTAARIGVVLAGGRATRMGGDKAGAMLGGQTLLERAVGIVTAAGLEPRVCARAPTLLPPVADLPDDAIWREPADDASEISAHPLAGLAYAAARAGEPIVAIPVDLPLFPPTALRALAAHSAALAVLATDGRPSALVARVDPSAAADLNAAAAAGLPALRTLVGLGAELVDLAQLAPAADVTLALTNVNCPDDLYGIKSLLREPR